MSFLVGFFAGVPAHWRKGLVDFVGEAFSFAAAADGRTLFSWGVGGEAQLVVSLLFPPPRFVLQT